jgi:hypothetical protein
VGFQRISRRREDCTARNHGWTAFVIVMSIHLLALTLRSQADETGMERRHPPVCRPTMLELIQFAQRAYLPEQVCIPEEYQSLRVIEDVATGLYAEIWLLEKNSDTVVQQTLIVTIRGADLSKFFTRPLELVSDVGGISLGGVLQQAVLWEPLTEVLGQFPEAKLMLVGHSLGGMVAQLAGAGVHRNDVDRRVSVIMINSPGVSTLMNPSRENTTCQTDDRLQFIHLLHQNDPVSRLKFFGEHHPSTRCYLFDSQAGSSHSLANIRDQLLRSQGVLPPVLTVSEVEQRWASIQKLEDEKRAVSAETASEMQVVESGASMDGRAAVCETFADREGRGDEDSSNAEN